MVKMTFRDEVNIAEYLGHGKFDVRPALPGSRWIVGCQCGYGAPQKNGRPSVTRATEKEAVKAIAQHIHKVVDTYIASVRANGSKIPAEALAGVR